MQSRGRARAASLFGATMASAFCLAAGAVAQPAPPEQPIRIEVGGYFMGYVLAGTQRDGGSRLGQRIRHYGIARESEIFFLGSTQLNNGLIAGVRVELEGETSGDQIDETYIFFEHIRFGRLELGQTKSAPNKMWYGAPDPVPGFGFNSPIFLTVLPGRNRADASTFVNMGATGDEEKLSLYTPQLWGFQFGFSLTPDSCEITGAGVCAGNAGLRTKRDIGQQQNAMEFAIAYSGMLGEVAYGAYAGAGFADVEQNNAQPGGVFRDRRQFGFGAQANWEGFTFGASYRWDNLGNRQGPDQFFFEPTGLAPTNQQDFNAGVVYQMGPWVFGLQYHRTWVELTTNAATGSRKLGQKDRMDGFIVGGTYLLGPGIQLAGGMEYRNFRGADRGTAGSKNDASNEGVVFMLGTRIDF